MIASQDLVLIDDNPCDIELTLREFEGQGFTGSVNIYRSGGDALAWVQALQDPQGPTSLPRAVLIGWRLPQVDGLEVLRRIKAGQRTRRIPTFLLLSSKHDEDYLTRQRVQPDGFLIKPVVFQEFVRQFGPAATRHFHGPQVTFNPNTA